jgi:ectoine hydroxylase-related dioxygenase (phytanoyl-CoA dioxygenase family)
MSEKSTLRLTAEQVDEYRKEGFIIYEDPVFPQRKFDALKEHFEEELAALPADVRPESMDVPHFTDVKLFEWLFSDEVLDLVEPIIGPDIALFSSHFICKPKGNGKRVPWHEDSFYWSKMISPMQVVTVWLAIDPSTRQNGAMLVIPRTLSGTSEHEEVDAEKNVLPWEVKRRPIDDGKAVTIELESNHASLHDGRLLHGSPPNTSDLRRCGYTMRYMPSSVKLSEESYAVHNIYLARGKDLAGNRYADPTKSYEELARYRRRSGNGH